MTWVQIKETNWADLEGAEHVPQYVRATYDQSISYYDLGPDKKNKLGGWVHSDFCQRYRFEKVYDWVFDVA
jgi:hypothetical protein